MKGIGFIAGAIALAALGSVGCVVDGFKGSNVQIDFAAAMPVQVEVGQTVGSGELPNNIHFTLYAVTDDTDASGSATQHLFAATQFEVHPLVNPASPCFIDLPPHSQYPGIQVTQYAKRVQQDTGITDIANPPPDATEVEKIAAATALQREINVGNLGTVHAITSVYAGNYTVGFSTGCAGDPGVDPTLFPLNTCFDDKSNAQRLAMCQAQWAADTDNALFEGTDVALALPLHGTEFGLVDGLNPVNSSAVGGSEWFLKDNLLGVTSYAIYWQYDAGTGPADEPPLGTLLLSGAPQMLTQGVEHVHMVAGDSSLTADMAVFPNLDDDGTGF